MSIPAAAQYRFPLKGDTKIYIRGGMKFGIPNVSKYDVCIDKVVTSRAACCFDGEDYYPGYEEFGEGDAGFGGYICDGIKSFYGFFRRFYRTRHLQNYYTPKNP